MTVLLAGLAACGGGGAPATDRTAPDTTIADTLITAAIQHEFLIDPAVQGARPGVTTDDGIVTLTGDVPSLLAAQAGVGIALATRGVRSVIDHLTVRPPARPDSAIAADVGRALLDDPATEAFEVNVTEQDGVVHLTGTVDSWAERTLAGRVASGVRGVRGLVNEIDVAVVNRTDEEIAREIDGLLATDVLLDDADITAEVHDGHVTLTGAVGSAVERKHAAEIAWVAGVRSVDADGLEARWWAQDQMTRDEHPTPDDDAIRGAIEEAYLLSPRVQAFTLAVGVDDGRVTLDGTVDNLQARREAERIALNTVGVRSVTDEITVRPPELADEALAQSVRRALARDPYLSPLTVTVVASHGVVTLSGAVDSRFLRRRAENVAGRQLAVSGVVNLLELSQTWTEKADEALAKDVRDELFWNPWITPGDVDVTVDAGTVTLDGTVDSWREKSEAENEAFQAGAKEVINDLTVAGGLPVPRNP